MEAELQSVKIQTSGSTVFIQILTLVIIIYMTLAND